MVVRPFEHQEAHRAVQRREKQHRIRHRNVVRHEERAAARRHPLAAGDVEPVQRVRQHPQKQPQQRIRQQPQNISRRRQRCERSPKKDRRRAEMHKTRQKIISTGSRADSDEGEQIGGGNDSAFLVLLRAVLDEGVDGNDEKSAKESQAGQQEQHCFERESVHRKQNAEHGHAQRSQRDQPVFNFPCGKVTRRQAAHSDANRNGRLKNCIRRRAQMEDVLPVNDDVKLQQRAQEPKIRIPENREPEHAIGADPLSLRPQISKKIRAKFFQRVGRGHARYSLAEEKPEESAAHKDRA